MEPAHRIPGGSVHKLPAGSLHLSRHGHQQRRAVERSACDCIVGGGAAAVANLWFRATGLCLVAAAIFAAFRYRMARVHAA